MRSRLLGVVAALGLIPLTATVAQAAEAVRWRDCGDGVLCAGVTVPSDWASPEHSEPITVNLAKLPARDQAHKLGSLLVNPGGPNVAIPNFKLSKASYADLTQWFDVVVFDPRGFGEGDGVSCPTPFPTAVDSPLQHKAFTDYRKANAEFAGSCAPKLGKLTGKINSWQVAHDMDAMRAALGERKLRYYGNSYGTVFGQAYAELFAHNVDRMFLDSVLDHGERRLFEWMAPMAATTERNLHRFAEWCSATETCALHGKDVIAVFDRVAPKAITVPARVADFSSSQTRWPALAEGLAKAEAGDTSAFDKAPRQPPDHSLARSMVCADFPFDAGFVGHKAIEHQLRSVAPRVGWADPIFGMTGHCDGLPRTGVHPPHRIRPVGLPPVLITSGSNDTITPVEHGKRVAAQLPGSRYLPAVGGHALYRGGNPCVRQHVHRYLTTGELPAATASCPAA
ncbi:alpha/beta hydrolase [Allokutzneria albata]|uniref:Alpha/beta hydrolase fold n=1 Tax=Allokutzneria albata TaxID=211114 RepID=A0A1G9YJF4_ALLAB|nr:alpha/beta hydrolase [Allokutzneria albata]SDN08646.1 alpha/beta hydrolase fold [Allokutzneria albata]